MNELSAKPEESEAECIIRNPPIVRPPPEDPSIRVIRCKPQPYYPGSGRIPPWAERIC